MMLLVLASSSGRVALVPREHVTYLLLVKKENKGEKRKERKTAAFTAALLYK